MKIFHGLYTALITPFDEKGKVNLQVLRELLQFQIEAGVDGIVLLGSTGESSTLTQAEKREIIRTAREETEGKLPLVVGTGSNATAQTIENTQEAKELGADGALLVTPYYNRPSQEGLYLHYLAIAEAVALPLLLYNVPGRTGVNIQTDTLERLAPHPHIHGIKECSGILSQMVEVMDRVRSSDFLILSGDDPLAFSCIMLGGAGLISVASNLLPVTMRKLIHASLEGDMWEARNLHEKLLPLFRALSLDTNPIPIKAAMKLSGFATGAHRLPLCSLSSTHHVQLALAMETLADILLENFESRITTHK